tara:strand:- start:322 stop:513 length:192 start_codon:yes stop_codon:yes gene_type:complete
VLSIPEVKPDEDTPEVIVLVAIKFKAPEAAVVNPLALELKANPELAAVVTSKLLKLNLVNAIM